MVKKQKITAQAMRQDVLNRLDASKKAILELSDDELESIAGGGKGPDVQLSPHVQRRNEHPNIRRGPALKQWSPQEQAMFRKFIDDHTNIKAEKHK